MSSHFGCGAVEAANNSQQPSLPFTGHSVDCLRLKNLCFGLRLSSGVFVCYVFVFCFFRSCPCPLVWAAEALPSGAAWLLLIVPSLLRCQPSRGFLFRFANFVTCCPARSDVNLPLYVCSFLDVCRFFTRTTGKCYSAVSATRKVVSSPDYWKANSRLLAYADFMPLSLEIVSGIPFGPLSVCVMSANVISLCTPCPLRVLFDTSTGRTSEQRDISRRWCWRCAVLRESRKEDKFLFGVLEG